MKNFLNLLLFTVTIVDCARILVISPTPSYSHQIVIHPIVKELSKRGHDVVFATTHPMRDENLTNLKEIDLGLQAHFRNKVCTAKRRLFNLVFELIEMLTAATDAQLHHPDVQDMIKNGTEYFDLIILEHLAPTMFAFKVRFNCPLIGFITMDGQNSDHKNFGNFDNPALYPNSFMYEIIANSFLQRVYNVFVSILFDLHREYILYPRANKIIRSHFGRGYPHIGEIIENSDMFFVTSNIILSSVRPITPSTISIGGGIHIKEAGKLPEKIASFLDDSKRGIIYISFGSNVHSSKLSYRVLELFLKTIAELPYDFLWKFEDETLPNRPENLLLMKWIPQQDVLRHKNVKLFITQAGMQSSEEALHYNVPILAIPFFVDQIYNAQQISEKQIGLMIEDVNTLTYYQLMHDILELLENPMYRENMKKFGRIVKDEPMKPIEKAIWWIEYVIRHKGAKHLKGPIVPFYQRYLFDVLAFFVLLILLFVFCIFKIFFYARKCLILKKLKIN